MKAHFEHLAINVQDKEQVAQWYNDHLGAQVAREVPGNMIFLKDDRGTVFLEIFSNPTAPVQNWSEVHYLTFHIAFEAEDPKTKAEYLLSHGASLEEAYREAGGDQLIMLRDPFGIPLQLIKRAVPFQRR
jgi:glyoxylase I family protein